MAKPKNQLTSTSLDSIINVKNKQNGENALLGILRGLPDAVLLIDANKRIVFHNQRATLLFGLDSDKISQHFFTELFPTDSALNVVDDNWRQFWKTLETDDRIESFETQMLDDKGKTLFVNITQTAIRDDSGSMIGFSAIVKDVSKTRESEQRITRRNAQLFALIDVAEAITAVSDVQTLLAQILDAVLRVTSLKSGCVYLLDEEGESLTLAVDQNLTPRAGE
ncbi:MAG: PAS domain-containing protein, partial [Pyrinomonadaceae bacterium]|nr:PAS domain-containing protein [Pyrinomonadaceae bacterium]